MNSYADVNRPCNASAPSVATLLAPVFAVADGTGLSYDAVWTEATGLGQPKAVDMATARTHKSITRPGSPPRGRHR